MTLYLHIGAQKTGSTTIQSALSHDRKKLRRAGLVYPRSEPGDRNKVSHYNSFRGYFSLSRDSVAQTRSFVDRINRIEGDLLLSSEALSNWPVVVSGERPEDYWARKQDVLRQIRTDLAHKDVRVIFCIRERASYLKSLFKQHLKVLKAPSVSLETELRAFLAREVMRSDMQRQIRVWSELFGEVRVIDFDHHARAGTLLPAFVATLDRPLELTDVKRRNVSPDWTQLEYLRLRRTFGSEVLSLDDAPRTVRNRVGEKVQSVARRILADDKPPGSVAGKGDRFNLMADAMVRSVIDEALAKA